jgi:hypothetical protein
VSGTFTSGTLGSIPPPGYVYAISSALNRSTVVM